MENGFRFGAFSHNSNRGGVRPRNDQDDSAVCRILEMITKYITEVTTRFNPFKKPSKTCRVFLAHLPADARTKMKINTTVLGRDSQEPSVLKLTFKDGKEMKLDTEKLNINDVVVEVDRHSRTLNRVADLEPL